MPTAAERDRLRATFTEDAALCGRVRPGYPGALFAGLAELAGVGPGCRVPEIGCGTGQATVPLAERGCEVTAVELGEAMASLARRRLARFPRVSVVRPAFGDWGLPAQPFDLVLAATAFHWIDPAAAVDKSATPLRPAARDGLLACIGHLIGARFGGRIRKRCLTELRVARRAG